MDDSDFAFGRSCAQIDDDSTTGGVGFSGYSDFHTIDWQRDLARDRMRHRHIIKKRGNSLWELIKVSFVKNKNKCAYIQLWRRRVHMFIAKSQNSITQNNLSSFVVQLFFLGCTWRSFWVAVCPVGGIGCWKCRWCDRHWGELDDWPKIRHLPSSFLA